jgi:hypothetical protein
MPEPSEDRVATESSRPVPGWLSIVTGRWFVKVAFLVFFVVAVIQLLRFERWARGLGPYVARPESVAGILPIGHFTSFFAWLRGGGWDRLLPAGLMLIVMSLAVSLLFKRGMCGWICPVGTVWEGFAAIGRRVLGRTVRVWRPLDILGRVVRYTLTVAFMVALLVVPLQGAIAFRELPYMWIADLKIVHLMAGWQWLAVAVFRLWSVWCGTLSARRAVLVGMASPCAVSAAMLHTATAVGMPTVERRRSASSRPSATVAWLRQDLSRGRVPGAEGSVSYAHPAVGVAASGRRTVAGDLRIRESAGCMGLESAARDVSASHYVWARRAAHSGLLRAIAS